MNDTRAASAAAATASFIGTLTSIVTRNVPTT
jgi:hypothetical protein